MIGTLLPAALNATVRTRHRHSLCVWRARSIIRYQIHLSSFPAKERTDKNRDGLGGAWRIQRIAKQGSKRGLSAVKVPPVSCCTGVGAEWHHPRTPYDTSGSPGCLKRHCRGELGEMRRMQTQRVEDISKMPFFLFVDMYLRLSGGQFDVGECLVSNLKCKQL
jgi:hypothetical protein